MGAVSSVGQSVPVLTGKVAESVAKNRRAVSSVGQSVCLTRRRSLVRAQHCPYIVVDFGVVVQFG